ncbi:hypothetical protein [Phenylobacterium aquaticum]|uniref:hypothetical protein n=1 Tax=Phenylobacterium aquaticum TaxID=1763816 RepID=UPI0026EC27ED|nr:hypothetical protein [Phenylobacterium aquaticum]
MTSKIIAFAPRLRQRPVAANALDDQTADLLRMVAHLSQRDLFALAAIVRRAAEISETDGEEIAIAVLDQIQGILDGREMDA